MRHYFTISLEDLSVVTILIDLWETPLQRISFDSRINQGWRPLQGKILVRPYAKAIHGMLPKTSYDASRRHVETHESINDLPVHPSTIRQIFYPTSESRHFTRKDASKVFDSTLLPADQRIPHPEMVQEAKEYGLGLSREQRTELKEKRIRQADQEHKDREARKVKTAAQSTEVVEPESGGASRWEWRFREMNIDHAGSDGRGPQGVGWRYGVPHDDRKKGVVKIPTHVL